MDLIWLIPVLPGIGAAINGLLGVRYLSKPAAALVACGTMAGSLVLSVVAFAQLLGLEERYHQVVLADWIPPIPLATAEGIILDDVMDDIERRFLANALDRTNGNLTQAAKILGMSYRSIRYKVKKLNVKELLKTE